MEIAFPNLRASTKSSAALTAPGRARGSNLKAERPLGLGEGVAQRSALKKRTRRGSLGEIPGGFMCLVRLER